MSKILVVDDRATEREFLVTLLRYARHDVLEAAHAAEALQLVQAGHPDLVISDVLLPEMDGYEFVRQLRADPATAGTAVIFYTAIFNEHEARALARDSGVVRMLSKPTEPEKILEVVAEVLGAGQNKVVAPLPAQFEHRHQQLLIDKLMQQVDALHQSEDLLRRSRDGLEIRVQERTTELAKANEALKTRATELERLNEELQEFSFVASHDLQEPLRKIRTFGDRLNAAYRDSLGEEGRNYLERMTRSAERMSTLLHALLAYSRIAIKPDPHERIDLAGVARDAASDLELAIEGVGAQVEIGNLPVATVDPDQMRQLFQNLIGNAVKYCDLSQNCTAPNVRVYGRTEGGVCRIFVEDNGIGFDEEHLDRIFRPFQRLHGRNEYEGTGMGLAICRKIAERHGGSITARSAPGKGSTFMVTLPLR